MKKLSIFLVFFAITSLLCSCGGVIGNIEKYRFTGVSLDSLKAAVAKVYIKHPELKKFDTTKYKEGGSTLRDANYYCTVNENNDLFIFEYAYPQYPSPNDTIVEIALTTAAKYGEDLKLAGDIGGFKKKKYRKLFEKYFITEVKTELKK